MHVMETGLHSRHLIAAGDPCIYRVATINIDDAELRLIEYVKTFVIAPLSNAQLYEITPVATPINLGTTGTPGTPDTPA